MRADSVNVFIYLFSASCAWLFLTAHYDVLMSFLTVLLQCGLCEMVLPGNAEDEPGCNECSFQTYH